MPTKQLYQKNVYFDVLDDIVVKYNNIYHRTIKRMAKPILMLNTMLILMKNILNLK